MRPLAEADFAQAADLLREGFPGHAPDFWPQALARLQRYGGNAEAGYPLGYFMLDKDQPVGVALTPASLRHRADGSIGRVVNISSWYVRQPYRWRAGFMLRGILADRSATYTDLTATPELQKTLATLGLQPINRGIAVHALPLLCLHPGQGVQLHELRPNQAWPQRGPPRALVEAHRELACLPVVLEQGATQQLVIFKHSRLRGLPAAQLVYAERRSQLLGDRGALARFLLARGFVFFVCETQHAASTATAWFRPREIWFASGNNFDDATDVFASELCLIHGQQSQP